MSIVCRGIGNSSNLVLGWHTTGWVCYNGGKALGTEGAMAIHPWRRMYSKGGSGFKKVQW